MESEHMVNGMDVRPFAQLLEEARERYTTAIGDALDEEMKNFLLPSDRVAVLEDAALFLCFIVALKKAEVLTPFTNGIDAKDPLRAWWPIKKRIDAEVGPMLLEFGREAAARQMKGTADEVR